MQERIPKRKTIPKSAAGCIPFDNEEEGRSCSLVGTEEYVSPEVVMGDTVTYSADLWSLGIIIYQMLKGVTPFKGINRCQTFHKILN